LKSVFGPVLSAALILTAVVASPVAAADAEVYEGRWNWSPKYKKRVGKNTKSIMVFRAPGSFRYCYETTCWTAEADIGPDGSLSFSTEGNNYFEFMSPEPGVFKGRFWVDSTGGARAPDATISMSQTF
jgi:hypothetical protein